MLFLGDILLAPINGFKFVLRTLVKVAEEQYTDDAPLKEQLLELQVKLENGDITEDEYVEQEAAILRELREIQNRKMELAGVEPSGSDQPFTGKVGEGSGASVTFSPQEETALPQLEIEAPQFSYGQSYESSPAEAEPAIQEITPGSGALITGEGGAESHPIQNIRRRKSPKSSSSSARNRKRR